MENLRDQWQYRLPFSMQIISDIHLEISNKMPNLIKSADNIALCGDIGQPKSNIYQAFIRRLSEQYNRVFVIMGNHEFYSSHHSMDEIISFVTEFCAQFANVIFLNNSSHVMSDFNLRIIGTTLWSDTSKHMSTVAAGINDYVRIKQKIYDKEGGYKRFPITPTYTNSLHNESVSFITSQINEANKCDQKVIILSHHLPTFANIHPHYIIVDINYGYATNLEHIIAPPICA